MHVTDLVRSGICTGCLACLSFCPKDNLAVRVGELGFPVPVVKEATLCAGCGECIRGCPFADEEEG